MPTILTTFAAQITASGITAPAYEDLLYTLTAQFNGIYGSDISPDNSTQDVQWLGILARAFYDCGQLCVAIYNAFRPGGAVGAGLSTIVKINGIAREVPSNSSAPVLIVGQAGTIITNGTVTDPVGFRWNLPASVTIPVTGQIIETITCQTGGSITLASGVALTIFTPTPGWQTVTTTAAATVGAPVETDAQLRARQTISTGLPAQTPLQAIVANVENLPGVTQVMPYENDTNSVNSLGLPPHSITLVVQGGNAVSIATVIAEKKTIGGLANGTTTELIIDPAGVPLTIGFDIAAIVQTYAMVTIAPLTGYVATTGTAITASLQTYVNALTIGQSEIANKLYSPANLSGDAATGATGQTQAALDLLSATYNVTSLYLARADGTVSTTITAGATSVSVANAASYAVGNGILLINSDGSQSLATVTAITGSSLTFTPAIATGKTVNAGSLVYTNGNLVAAYNENLTITNASQIMLVT